MTRELQLPRHFVARTEAEPAPEPLPATLTQLVDLFVWRGGLTTEEIAVVRDFSGRLYPWNRIRDLPDALRTAVTHQELLGPTRTVESAVLWLMEVEALEQTPETPGTNDPIWLRGWLVGQGIRIGGRLAMTRGDLLRGFVEHSRHALSLAAANSLGGRSARVLHAVVPGGRTDEIAQGQGVILAYPLVPIELQASDAANEYAVDQLLHDVLGALRADYRAAGVAHWLIDAVVPVPNRAEVERHLTDEGWQIRGDEAIRPRGPKTGFAQFLTMALGDPEMPRQTLPPEAKSGDLLALAAKALATLDGFPDERSKRLHTRVSVGTSASAATAPPPGENPPTAPQARMPKGVVRAVSTPPPVEDWRRDFAAKPPARVTPVQNPPKKPPSRTKSDPPAAPRDWLDDFKK